MIRNLKSLGLMAFAALAMSMMFASAASAQLGTFTGGDKTPAVQHTPVTIIGEQYPDPQGAPEAVEKEWTEWNYFKATPEAAESLRCDTVKYTGTDADGIATSIRVTPDYTHCSAYKGAEIHPITVTHNGCEYIFKQPETIAPLKTGTYTGKVDLTCPEEKRIVIHVYGAGNATETSHFFNLCTIEVWPKGAGMDRTQELGGHVTYKNIEGVKHDITVKAELTGITSTSNCPGGGLQETGKFTSTVTVKAFNDPVEGPHETQTDTWISDEGNP